MLRYLSGLISLLVCVPMANAAAVQFAARQDIATSAKHLTGLAVADFNGDGKPDIAVTDDYSQVITVYLNDGSGGFSKSVTTTLNVPSIGGLGALVAGDVNEDGKQDLIVAPVAGLQYDIVLLGNGDGTFTQKGQISTSYGFGAAT
ncbi:MAG TPA: VCBS repeat-containing protein [Acidobacteriaceae bacterium]|nr:VCBS repeat-containing protein [Acidobacteriaceae bacterium]